VEGLMKLEWDRQERAVGKKTEKKRRRVKIREDVDPKKKLKSILEAAVQPHVTATPDITLGELARP